MCYLGPTFHSPTRNSSIIGRETAPKDVAANDGKEPVRKTVRLLLIILLFSSAIACRRTYDFQSEVASPTPLASGVIATPTPFITDEMRRLARLDPKARYVAQEGEQPAAVSTGSMSEARAVHTQSLLQDGRVLVVGGSRNLSAPELYDPSTGEWSSTAGMLEPRTSATATGLQDGRVLVAGGKGESGILASAELYDPSSDVWSSAGDMVEPRRAHAATLLRDGRVLVVAGESTGGAIGAAELYDPSSGTWSSAGNLAQPRTNHDATLLMDGGVVVTGGATFTGTLHSLEIYDPASGNWSSAGTMAEVRMGHPSVLLADGTVLFAGGQEHLGSPFRPLDTTELYDPSTEEQSSAGNLAQPRSLSAAVLLEDGTVVVTGGRDKDALDLVEVFDPATGNWALVQGLMHPRRSHTATLLPDGKILIAGGRDDAGRLASAELYDPQNLR